MIDSLEMAEEAAHAAQKDRNWQIEPLADLVAHIKNTHHKYTREEMARLVPLLDKVCSVHGKNHPELQQVRASLPGLGSGTDDTHDERRAGSVSHYREDGGGRHSKGTGTTATCLAACKTPCSMMEHEHDSAGNALRTMREASCGYTAPADACISYQTLYKALADFEADLHQHIPSGEQYSVSPGDSDGKRLHLP